MKTNNNLDFNTWVETTNNLARLAAYFTFLGLSYQYYTNSTSSGAKEDEKLEKMIQIQSLEMAKKQKELEESITRNYFNKNLLFLQGCNYRVS